MLLLQRAWVSAVWAMLYTPWNSGVPRLEPVRISRGRLFMGVHYDVFETSWGWVAAIGAERGLRHLSLPEEAPERALEHLAVALRKEQPEARPGAFAELHDELDAYFAGRCSHPEAVLDLEGASPFFLASWEACRSIPPGVTQTYKWLADQAGRPRAVRAAGQAMARNRVPLLIPCHRVVGSDGGLHGFAGPGIGMKAELIRMEAARAAVTPT